MGNELECEKSRGTREAVRARCSSSDVSRERISGRDAIGKCFKKLLDSSILGPLSIIAATK
jgi:hypothetical protein